MTDQRFNELEQNYKVNGFNSEAEINEILEAGDEARIAEESKPVLPEAPLSIHIDAYYQGFHIGFTKRSDEESVSNQVDGVTKLIQSLISKGFEPSWNKETTNGHLKKAEPQAPSQQAPTCGIHGTQMVWKQGVSKTTNKPYAFWTCPTKNADGSYCNFKPKQ